MMTRKQVTKVQAALKMDEVPVEKFRDMAQRSIVGALFVGLGIYGAVELEWGKEWVIGMVLFGATVWSRQVVTGTLMALIRPIQAIRRAKDSE